ncbi:nucleoid-associated protein [Larsenimonas rhizosphaerae]|uniref:Nucleoid-associated protein n=1 Tax=Larsenimonas rhizosphaerae TaxID=2944682 RepID=A0AA41ZDE8_9GAMM|nr:nucleoid-associated protein [Larsenimonas rhizosphaerae]MCX2522777.1 nucleoid-associated protein [Larsenimonas rhizosphaerae]
MPIQQSLMHRLALDDASNALSLQLADSEQQPTPALDDLLSHCLKLFNGKSKGFGHAGDTPAPQSLLGCLDTWQRQDTDFPTATHHAAQALAPALQEHLSASGYLWCVHYTQGENTFVAVILLHDRQGYGMDEQGNVHLSPQLNTSQFSLAVRIDLTQWQRGGNSNYVAYLKSGGAKNMMDAFHGWLGCEEGGDSARETRALLQAFSEYVGSEDMSEEDSREKTDAVVSYATDQASTGEPMSLDEFSRLVSDENPEAFFDYIRNSDYGLADEVPADRKTINQFRRFTGRASGVSISFDSHLLGDSIEYNEDADRLIIKKVPEKLKAQLLERQRH